MTVGVARQHAGITGQGTAMVTGAISAGVPFGWAAGDEVYGRSSNLRARPVPGRLGGPAAGRGPALKAGSERRHRPRRVCRLSLPCGHLHGAA